MGEQRAEESLQLAQAVWFAGPRAAVLRRELVPAPGPGAIRVRALASAISHGTELLVYRGDVAPELALDLPTLAGGYGFPIKFGYAVVGQVLDVGAEVKGIAAGDTVFALHPHQSVFLTPATLAVRLPPEIDVQSGLFFANLETALTVLHDSPLKLGETALVFGQGTVGLLITQLLRMAGAGHVIVVEPIERRRELALRLGADAALSPGPELAAHVRLLTEGRGADVAVEVSGAPGALQSAIDALAEEGTAVVASWYGTKPVALQLGERFHRGRLRLRASQVGRISPELAPRWDRARRTREVLRLLPKLRLSQLVSQSFPLEEAARAYALIDERPQETVQVLLKYD